MADEDQEVEAPWSDQAEAAIYEIDKITTDKQGISLRDFLLNPDKYVNNADAAQKLKGLRTAVDDYFDGQLKPYAGEAQRLQSELQDLDAQYNKMNEIITNRASLARVPYLKPANVKYDEDAVEEIVVEQYNGSVDLLITKLLTGSNYIADLSDTYDKYTLGSWLFSGQRQYVVTLNPPVSPVMSLQASKAEVMLILDYEDDMIGQKGT